MNQEQKTQLATLCYVKDGTKILLVRRDGDPTDVHYGKYNGLGGKNMPGESPEECVKREVLEESGLEIFSPKLKGMLLFPDFTPKTDWFVSVFLAECFSGEIQVSEAEAAKGSLHWVEVEDLWTLNMWDGDKVFLPRVFLEGIFSGTFKYKDGSLVSHEIVFYES